jgi:hypothetical protein
MSNTSTEARDSKKKSKTKLQIPEYSNDEASKYDGVDYTLPENYAVKKFIGHQEQQKKKKRETNLSPYKMEGMVRQGVHYLGTTGEHGPGLA